MAARRSASLHLAPIADRCSPGVTAGPQRRARADQISRRAVRAGRRGRSSTAGRLTTTPPLSRLFSTSCRALNGERQPGRDDARSPTALRDVCRRAFAASPARGGRRAQILRGQFPAAAHQQARRQRRLSHRLLRADHRRLARADRRVHRAAVIAGRPISWHRGRRKLGDRLSQQGREGRPPVRPAQDRALLRRAARSRTARSTAGIWKSAGCAASSMCCSRRSRARRASGWRTAPFCASTTIRTTAGPIRRSAAC